MIALALEFSTDVRSVAVARGETVLAEVHYAGTVRTPVFALIADALKQAGVTRDQIELLAVGIGPGSYTGVRLALAVAQGWQLATGVKTVGVNSLGTLARAVTTPTLLAVDAQRGELAVARAENGLLLEPVRLLPLAELRLLQAAGEVIAGPGLERFLPTAIPLFPAASQTLRLARLEPASVPAETLAPVYLRVASFVKAPTPRSLPGFES
jgi:tRNA threonylcarbamoyl adenosine modification protein YeaZ